MSALLWLIGGGFGLLATAWLLRVVQVTRQQAALVGYRLTFPRDVKPEQVTAVLASLAGRRVGRERFVFEVTGRGGAIEHRLLVPRPAVEFVMSQLRAAVPGLHVALDDTAPLASFGRELRLTSWDRPLNTGDPAGTARALLAALAPVSQARDESVTVQWLITPTLVAPVVPDHPTNATPMLLRLLRGEVLRQPADLKLARTKRQAPAFLATARIGVAARGRVRAIQLLARPLAALRSAGLPGVTFRLRWLPAGLVARRVVARALPILPGSVLINVTELTGLLGWPLGSLAVPGLTLDAVPQLPVPASLPRSGLVLGTATYPGMERPVAIGYSDALRHLYLPGVTGAGKSTAAANMIIQQVEAGYGVAVIDPRGDLIDTLLDAFPPKHAERVVLVDPRDDRPVGLNLLDGPRGEADLTADQVVGVFAHRFASTWGPRTDDIARAAIHALLADPDSTLIDLPSLLANPAVRRRLLARITDPHQQQFWATYESWSEAERAHNTAPLLNKARVVLMRRAVRGILGQPSAISFDAVLRERKVLLINLREGLIGSDAAALLGGLIFARLYAAVQRRVALPVEARTPFFGWLDEFQTLVSTPTPLEAVLAQARGYGFGLALLHQHLAQLPQDVRQAVLANCRTKLVFTVSAADAGVLAREFAPALDASTLVRLGPYQAVLAASVNTTQQPPVTIETAPPPPTTGQADAIRERSRKRYGRPIAEVEAAWAARQQMVDANEDIGRRRTD